MAHAVEVHTLILVQHDLARALMFYQSLGALCMAEQSGWAEVAIGRVTLVLCVVPEPVQRSSGIVFAVHDLEHTLGKLKAVGYEPDLMTQTEKGTVVCITDPGGNKIELIAAHQFKDGMAQTPQCCPPSL